MLQALKSKNRRRAASANGPSFRKYRTWQAAYNVYLKAYSSDKVRVTLENNYHPKVQQPSPGDCEAMFWEWVDGLAAEPSADDNDGT
jgi:hypothetical protein